MGNDLGKRHVCFSCQAKFYDLLRERAVCPKCDSDQEDAVKPDSASGKKTSKGKKRVAPRLEEFDNTDHEEDDDPVKDGDIPINMKVDL